LIVFTAFRTARCGRRRIDRDHITLRFTNSCARPEIAVAPMAAPTRKVLAVLGDSDT